ncbi:MAG: hypothetical protein ABSF50_23290 [Burkholderiaceae bacterium]|jgi:hypothetical protein
MTATIGCNIPLHNLDQARFERKRIVAQRNALRAMHIFCGEIALDANKIAQVLLFAGMTRAKA